MPRKISFPKRVFNNAEKKLFSLRMPTDLKSVLERYARENGLTLTQLILIILDRFGQEIEPRPPNKRQNTKALAK